MNNDETPSSFRFRSFDSSLEVSNEPRILSSESASNEDSPLVMARGIAEGLVIRLDGSADPLVLQAALREFMISRSGFLKGASVFLSWFAGEPSSSLDRDVRSILKKEFFVDAELLPKKLCSKIEVGRDMEAGRGNMRESDINLSLFDGIDVDDAMVEADVEMELDSRLVDDVRDEVLGDVADARMVFGTLRSGQRIESEHSVVVAGDINSGAEVVAGGDIFVLGKLRGVAHAGAYDETGGGRVIFALELEPTQLRIGSVITRGGGDEKGGRSRSKRKSELARVDGNMILVEPYHNRRIGVSHRIGGR